MTYLKSHGKNIILRESTIHEGSLSGLGWFLPPAPAPPVAGNNSPNDPFAALRSIPATPSPKPWGALATQAQTPPSQGGGFFGNLLQGGIDALRNIGSGGAPSAPSAPIMAAQPQQSALGGMLPILLLGGAAVAAFAILKKRKKR